MRTRAAWLVVGFLVAGCVTAPPVPTPTSDTVKAEIEGALRRWNDDAARGDVAAFMSQFDDAADIVLVGSDKGEIFEGRDRIEGWLGKLMAKGRFSWRMDRVDVGANGDTAWAFVDGAMTVKNVEGKVLFTTPYRFTGVLVKRGDRWAWRLFNGSIPRGE